MENCTLCQSDSITVLDTEGDKRQYFLCGECQLIFAASRYHLSSQMEKKQYLLHRNGPQHEGHVNFLKRIVDPALIYLRTGMRGLDYGCGPVPTLSVILRNQGLVCYDYDPLFDFDHPLEIYDFLFATECFEHFYNPAEDFQKIDQLLKSGGFLAIMTERWDTLTLFNKWYYKTEATHVSFFHMSTFQYLCETFNYRIKFSDKNRIIILQKQ